ncbi:MAG: PfkB family carbohydrate kinase, partial [Chloroflexota bacterium]|nr:PfkB family carbohydrate kinase [Chloroflexota bacterium]
MHPSLSNRRARPRLVALGDLVLDIVVAPEVAIASGTDVGGSIRFRTGGSAANVARSFAALGGQATFVGGVGADALGRRLVATLRSAGVTVHAARVRQPTARLVVLLGPGGERSFVTQRGAADYLRPVDLRRAWVRRAGVLHLPAYSLLAEPLAAAARQAAEWAHAGGGIVSVDLASARPLLGMGRRAARRLIADVAPDLLLANADEAAALVARGAAERLVALAPCVVIKEGAEGCRVMWRADAADPASELLQLTVATRRIDTTDTTGAGDAFDAG